MVRVGRGEVEGEEEGVVVRIVLAEAGDVGVRTVEAGAAVLVV